MSLLLLFLLFSSQVGYYFIYAYRQYELRETMWFEQLQQAPESALETIDLSANLDHIQWEEAGREFYLHGQLYDVAYIKSFNGKTVIYCLNDNKEEIFRSGLSKLVGGKSNQNDNNGQHHIAYKFQLSDCIIATDNNDILANTAARQQQPVYADVLPVGFTTISTPPPDLIF